MSWQQAKRLREERADIVRKMQDIIGQAEREKRDLTDDERKQVDDMQAAATAKRHDFERIERVEKELRESEAVLDSAERADHERQKQYADADNVVTRDDVNLAMRAWYLSSALPNAVTREMRSAAEKCAVQLGSPSLDNLKFRKEPLTKQQAMAIVNGLFYRATGAQTVTTTKGGHTFTSEFMSRLEVQMALYGGVREVATVLRSDNGRTLLWPTVDDTANVATVLAINTAVAGKDLTFGQHSIPTYKYTSGLILVPMELIQDNDVDLMAYIGDAIGRRVAAGTNSGFTTGSTTGGGPVGIVTRAISTVNATSTASNKPTYSLMKDLQHSVDPAYRQNASWMMNDDVLGVIEKIVDTNGNPIFQGARDLGGVDRIFGHRVVINQSMATSTGTSKKIVLFGDMSKYLVRDPLSIDSLQLNERYAEKAQVGFVSFSRHGGDKIFASTSNAAIQAMVQTNT